MVVISPSTSAAANWQERTEIPSTCTVQGTTLRNPAAAGIACCCALKLHNRTNGFAFVHQVKAVVDLVQCQFMRDHRINLDLAIHVPIDDFWHIGTPLGTAKSCPTPDATGNQLERTGVHKIGHAEISANFGFVVVQIHANDLIRASKAQPLDHVQPDSAQTEHHTTRADLYLGGVDHRTDTCGHATAE
ncbi:hypothetical protein GQR58_030726 [Nymphon striatum]|nr:hypothetical protein GQR58_030726 [Nymphon striatum]